MSATIVKLCNVGKLNRVNRAKTEGRLPTRGTRGIASVRCVVVSGVARGRGRRIVCSRALCARGYRARLMWSGTQFKICSGRPLDDGKSPRRGKGGGNPKGWGVNARYLAFDGRPVRVRWRVGLDWWCIEKMALPGTAVLERWREIGALFKDFLKQFVGEWIVDMSLIMVILWSSY